MASAYQSDNGPQLRLLRRNSISSVGGPIMLLAVAQQEDEVPTVRREAIAALVAVLEDDKRKIEVASTSVHSSVPSAV